MQREIKKAFIAGLYMRLSKDDDGAEESASISTQRDILHAYAESQGIPVYDEYVDDGYSGTNYDRPDFQRMIGDVKDGHINCVITKDLSRLGRNSSKTTDLLEEIFPKYGVRYISVTDGFDSFAVSNGMAIAAPFMILVNELYARDISQKIRSSFRSKMENGSFVSSFAPYGYQKDPESKNRLIVDEEAAGVVESIFRMAANGWRTSDIAKKLNEDGVPTPSVYRCMKNPHLDINNYSKRREWTSVIICKMLRNSVYLGQTEHGKTTKVSFKCKETRTNKREDWIVVENTHEAIISKELFDLVRRRSASRRCSPNRGFVNVFSGVAKCADCGRNMTTAPTRKRGSTYNLCCGGYKAYGARECGNHFVDYDILYNVVMEELRSVLTLTDKERREIVSSLGSMDDMRSGGGGKRTGDLLKKKEKRLQEVNSLIKKAFELYAFGDQSESTYSKLISEYEKERDALEQAIRAMRNLAEQEESKEKQYMKFFALLDSVQNVETLTPDIVKRLIDRIEVEQGHYETTEDGKKIKRQSIRIYYRFIGCIEKAS